MRIADIYPPRAEGDDDPVLRDGERLRVGRTIMDSAAALDRPNFGDGKPGGAWDSVLSKDAAAKPTKAEGWADAAALVNARSVSDGGNAWGSAIAAFNADHARGRV